MTMDYDPQLLVTKPLEQDGPVSLDPVMGSQLKALLGNWGRSSILTLVLAEVD